MAIKRCKVDPIIAKAIKANKQSKQTREQRKAIKSQHDFEAERLNNSEELRAYMREQSSVYRAQGKKVVRPKKSKAEKVEHIPENIRETLMIVRACAR